MGNFAKASSDVGAYRFQSGQARARGIQQRAEALQRAYSLENESAQNSYLAMQNMAAMRENQAAAMAAVLTQAGSRGFVASSGSQRMNQQVVADMYETQIANANKSNVIADENARMQANAYRHYGQQSMAMANIEADYYSSLASAASKSRWAYLLGDTLTLGGNVAMQYGGGNDNLWPWQTKEAKKG